MSNPRHALAPPTRRLIIQRVPAAAACVLAAPDVEWISNMLAKAPAGSLEFEQHAAKLLIGTASAARFAAQAQWLAGIALFLGAVAAIVEILQYFGIRPHFESQVRYDAAGSRKTEFEHREYAARQDSFQNFSGVSRSRFDDKQVLLAAASNAPQQLPAQSGILISRYDDPTRKTDLITLDGIEANVLHSAIQFLAERHNLTGRSLVVATAVVEKRNRTFEGIPVRTLHTACDGFIHYVDTPSLQYPHGCISLYVPGVTEPSRLPILAVQT